MTLDDLKDEVVKEFGLRVNTNRKAYLKGYLTIIPEHIE